MEPSDILLGLLIAFSRLVDCSLLLTRKVTDFKICKYIPFVLNVCVKVWCLWAVVLAWGSVLSRNLMTGDNVAGLLENWRHLRRKVGTLWGK